MSNKLVETETQRARWTRYRASQLLLDPNGDDYALGGLGTAVDKLDVRFLFLPTDPYSDVVSLDEEALAWFKAERPSPYEGAGITWGFRSRATSNALVVYDQHRDSGGWDNYMALHRHGGVEFGRSKLAWQSNDLRAFSLRSIVGLVWSALDVQVEANARWNLSPPFEMTLAIRNTEGAALGGFAEGWRDPGGFSYDAPTCMEKHVLLHWDLDGGFDARDLAMDVGDRVEQAFGTTNRRHLANRGKYEGRFDPRF
jgi:hypothetical protein